LAGPTFILFIKISKNITNDHISEVSAAVSHVEL